MNITLKPTICLGKHKSECITSKWSGKTCTTKLHFAKIEWIGSQMLLFLGGGWFSYIWTSLEFVWNLHYRLVNESTHSALSFTPVRTYLRCSALRVYFALSRWKSCRWPGEWQKGCAKIDVVNRVRFWRVRFLKKWKEAHIKKKGQQRFSSTNSFWIKTIVFWNAFWSINLSLFLSALHVPSHQQRCCGRFGW